MRVRIATSITSLFFILVLFVLIRDLNKFSVSLFVPQKDVKSIQNEPFVNTEISRSVPQDKPFVSQDKQITIPPTLTSANIPTEYYSVVRIIDGDTIVVSINDKNETVRLLGIDTPEVVDPRKPIQCFGREASNKVKEILTGKNIRLESDTTQADRDKYKRLLRYIYLPDGANVNLLLINEGYAHEYTYDNPYRYQQEFRQAEKEARDAKKGLWGNMCIGRD